MSWRAIHSPTSTSRHSSRTIPSQTPGPLKPLCRRPAQPWPPLRSTGSSMPSAATTTVPLSTTSTRTTLRLTLGRQNLLFRPPLIMSAPSRPSTGSFTCSNPARRRLHTLMIHPQVSSPPRHRFLYHLQRVQRPALLTELYTLSGEVLRLVNRLTLFKPTILRPTVGRRWLQCRPRVFSYRAVLSATYCMPWEVQLRLYIIATTILPLMRCSTPY